jgi:hypothetical protein
MPSLYFWDPCADGASVMVCAVIKKRTTDRDADLGKGYFCPRIRTQSYQLQALKRRSDNFHQLHTKALGLTS